MTSMQKRGPAETMSPFGRLDRMFDEWLRALPMRRMPIMGFDVPGEELIRVDEYREGDTQVIRAELPGIDPDKDVEISVSDGIMHLQAVRRERSEDERPDGYRSEFRYGSLERRFRLPQGTTEKDIKATYHDGILEVRVPAPKQVKAAARIPIARS